MKKLVILALALGLFGIANAENLKEAQEHKTLQTQTIQYVDLESLFGSSNVNAIALSQEEMEATKGEGLLSWLGLIPIRPVCFLLCIRR